MLSNYENIIIKKEVTEGTFEIPTESYDVNFVSLNTIVPKQSLASINGKLLDSSRKVAGVKDVNGNLSFYAYNEILGLALTGVIGNATSVTNLGDGKYEHSFDVNKQGLPTYTVEVEKGAYSSRYSGIKFNTLGLSVEENAFKVDTSLVGLKSLEGNQIESSDGVDTITLRENVGYTSADTIDIFNTKGEIVLKNVDIVSVSGNDIVIADASTVLDGYSISLSKRTGLSKILPTNDFLFCKSNIKFEVDSANAFETKVEGLTLNINNNIDTNKGKTSGSCFKTSNPQKQRNLNGNIVIDIEQDGVKEILSRYIVGDDIKIELSVNDTDGNSLILKGNVSITKLLIDLNANDYITANVSFEFTSIDSLKLTTPNPAY